MENKDMKIEDPIFMNKKKPRITVSTTIDHDLWDIAKFENISWKDALEVGIKFIVADRDGGLNHEYPSSNLSEKLRKVVTTLNAKSQECDALRQQMEGNKTEITDEIDQVFQKEKKGDKDEK